MTDRWPRVALGGLLTDMQPGFASGRHNSEGQGLPHFRPMNISTEGRIERSVMRYIDPSAGRSDIRLTQGDILFNNTNSPELVGKTALFDDVDSPAFSNHMTRLRVDDTKLDARYAALRLHQAWREGWFASHCNNHVSQASIGREVLKGFQIELPPLEVQRAIASLSAAIDRSRSSASVHVAAASRSINRMREAVLAAACVGRMTTDWREEHPNSVSAKRALAERAPSIRRRFGEAPVELALPELPTSYVVAAIGDVADFIEYGTSKRCDADADDGVPVLRMGNIQDGALDMSDLKYCEVDDEIERLMLARGDLLFNRTNSPELVGKSAVFTSDKPMCFASYLIRVRFDDGLVLPEFANYWLNSAWGRQWARLAKTDGVSQSNINGTKLALMALPLPPIEEQRAIVDRASALLSWASRTLDRATTAERVVARSWQATLAKAFRGDLTAAEV